MKIDVKKYKKEKFGELLSCGANNCELSLEWKKTFHNGPGVYLIKINDVIVYVGETSNLQKRMNDMRNTKNHTVRRNLGNDLYQKINGFEKATAKKSFIPKIESKLEAYMMNNLQIFTLSLDLGRKELEEYVIDKYGKPKYNIRGNKRLNSKDK